MFRREASSQAAWALIIEGVAAARVEAHRLKHMVTRAMSLVDQSDHKDHLYQMAGDIIQGAPRRLERLELDLDRTSLALVKMGEKFLEARLPIQDKTQVEEAVLPAFGGGGAVRYASRGHLAVDRVAMRHLLATLQVGKV